jgi:hypothetical protein
VNDSPATVVTEGTPAAASAAGRVSTRWWQWWPLLLGPLGMAIGCLVIETGVYRKETQEVIAIVIAAVTALVGVGRAVRHRHRFAMVLGTLTVVVLLREIHWAWMGPGVYIAIALVVAWAIAWWRTLAPYTAARPWVRVWLVATAITYFLSQFLARRGLQHLVGEETALGVYFEGTYDAMEEVVENTGHLMLLVTALVATYPKNRKEAAS